MNHIISNHQCSHSLKRCQLFEKDYLYRGFPACFYF